MKHALWLLIACWLPLAHAEESTMTFDVYLDNSQIGFHQVNIERLENEKRVQVEANMSVDILFFTAFSYKHQARERWTQGCIVELETRTNDDGEELAVIGKQTGDGLEVVTNSERKQIDGCVHTFAYWDVDLLSSDYLLNTQNGKYEQAQLVKLDPLPLEFNGKTYGNQRYRLEIGEDVAINLWYSSDNTWQALETKVTGGKTLRYVRRQS
jgi:hypothetical protein